MEQLQRPSYIWGKICSFPHILGSPSSYKMQLLHSEFPFIWGKFCFLFYQCIVERIKWKRPGFLSCRLTCFQPKGVTKRRRLFGLIEPQSVQSARLSLQSSELGPPPPLPQASVTPLSFGSKLRERAWGNPIQTKGKTLWYSVYTIIPLRIAPSYMNDWWERKRHAEGAS